MRISWRRPVHTLGVVAICATTRLAAQGTGGEVLPAVTARIVVTVPVIIRIEIDPTVIGVDGTPCHRVRSNAPEVRAQADPSGCLLPERGVVGPQVGLASTIFVRRAFLP